MAWHPLSTIQIVEMLRESLEPPLGPRDPQISRILEDPGCVALEVLQQLLPLEVVSTPAETSSQSHPGDPCNHSDLDGTPAGGLDGACFNDQPSSHIVF